MESKKSKKASLENKRGIFFQTGLVIALGLSLVAFEWYSPRKAVEVRHGPISLYDDIETTVITRPEENKVKPPEPVKHPEIKVVDNDAFIEDLDINSLFNPDESWDIDYIVEEHRDPVDFRKIEDFPRYKGGDHMVFWKDVNSRLIYPQIAVDAGIEGTVFVSFVVDKTGKMTDIKILRSKDPILSNEVLRVLKNSKTWTPGMQRKRPVDVSYSMAFKFKLTQ